MQEGLNERLFRMFMMGLVLAIIVVGLVVAWPSYMRGRSLKQQELEMQAQIEAKKLEIAQLVENQRRFKTDRDFVEAIARQNKRVFPGELVFIFEED